MMRGEFQVSRTREAMGQGGRLLRALHLDGPLLLGLAAIIGFGLFVLYSALGGNTGLWLRQVAGVAAAIVGMVVLAQIPPRVIRMLTPLAYVLGIVLLALVATVGDVSKGAQRWLDLGVIRFQPSELMKVAVPLMCAWYVHERPLPPSLPHVAVVVLIFAVPAAFIAEQPDLDTAVLVCASGFFILLLGGLQLRWIGVGAALLAAAAPVAWHLLHDFQRRRVLTMLDPESDPLGAGYHIIQSQIAIGSGGVFGKGWMNGSQAQLEFLPERSTDFIFAVIGEEIGLLGQLTLIALYVLVLGRALFLAAQCNDTFGRLFAGSVALTFFVYVFVNTGMVVGLLPVMGLPLPLVSYGGTSMVTLLAGFGILQGLHSHRKLVRT